MDKETEARLKVLEDRMETFENVSVILRSERGFIARAIPEVYDKDVKFYHIINKENKIVNGYFVYEYKGFERVAKLGNSNERTRFSITIDGEKVDFEYKENF